MARQVFSAELAPGQLARLRTLANRAPGIVAPVVRRMVQRTLQEDVLGPLKRTLPIGVTGNLRQGQEVTLSGSGLNTEGRAHPTISYAPFVEHGRGPGGAPFAPIAEWARRKGFDLRAARGIWISIMRHGTRRFRTKQPGEWQRVAEAVPRKLVGQTERAAQEIAQKIAAQVRGDG